jgi:hypothetical protein
MKVIKFAPGLIPVLKHQDHDQSTHGSWSDGQEDYKMGHRPGDIESGASLDNVSGNDIYPDDVYTPNGLRNYSTGYPELDKEAHALIMRAKGNPEMTVTIYRAVPNDAKITEIKDGDWVTPTKGYAKIHGESNLNDDYKIISAEVKAKDIYTSGDSWHEWGYSKSSSVEKHQEHDQSSHGNWAKGGNGLSILQTMGLRKSSDPLQKDIYAAEQSLDSVPLRDKFPKHPEREIGESTEDYDKRYKEYTDKYEEWAIAVRTRIVSQTGETLLDGSPSGVKKYISETIKQDWFIEAFGDGKSLPPLDVKVVDAPMSSAAGRYRQDAVTDGADRLISSTHEISIDRQSVKAEQVILHEIAHYATAASQTTSYEGHGVEFARNHIFIVEKVAGLERATKLKTAYEKRGIKVGN